MIFFSVKPQGLPIFGSLPSRQRNGGAIVTSSDFLSFVRKKKTEKGEEEE